MTLEGLINAEGSSLVELAESLGISPAEEDDRIGTLNAIMRHLGVSCRHFDSLLAIHQMTADALRSRTEAYHHERGYY